MKINIINLVYILSGLLYVVLIILFGYDLLQYSDANSIYGYVYNVINFQTLNITLFINSLPYMAENLFLSFLALLTSSFFNKTNFTILATLITFIITVYTSNKILNYNGLTRLYSLLISIVSVGLYLLTPIGKLGLINTQSSFIALQLAYATGSLIKPKFYYTFFHWVYIPATLFIFLSKSFTDLIKTLSLKINLGKSLFFLVFLLIGISSLTYIGKLQSILIDSVESSINPIITIGLSLILFLINIIYWKVTHRNLYLNLSFISLVCLILAFISSKTSNRLLITLIFYDYATLISIVFKNLKRRRFNMTSYK